MTVMFAVNQYLAAGVPDLVRQLLVTDHLHHDLLEGVLLAEELADLLLGLHGHQRRVLVVHA